MKHKGTALLCAACLAFTGAAAAMPVTTAVYAAETTLPIWWGDAGVGTVIQPNDIFETTSNWFIGSFPPEDFDIKDIPNEYTYKKWKMTPFILSGNQWTFTFEYADDEADKPFKTTFQFTADIPEGRTAEDVPTGIVLSDCTTTLDWYNHTMYHFSYKLLYSDTYIISYGGVSREFEILQGKGGVEYTLPDAPIDRYDKVFAGWEIDGTLYQPNEKVLIQKNTTIKAIFQDRVFNGMEYYYMNSEESPYVWIVGYTEDLPANIEIPSTIEGAPVTALKYYTFQKCSYLKSVKLPDTLQLIDVDCFLNCTKLTEIVVPKTVGDETKQVTETLGGMTHTRTDRISGINQGAFSGCTRLEKITILNEDAFIYDAEDTLGDSDYTTIFGYTGSTAEAYAKKYGYKFTALDAADTRGDMDGSGTITADDAQMALMAYLKQLSAGDSGLTAEQFAIADVDNNGILNADDAQYILIYATQFLAGLNPQWSDIIQ